MKRCPHCGLEKDESEFNKQKARKDGLHYWCRECNKDNMRKWREKHKEHERVYRENTKEKINTRVRKWQKTNKERDIENKRHWWRNNAEKRKEYRHKRRALKIQAGGAFTAQDIKTLEVYQSCQCEYCGKDTSDGYHIDHVHALNIGGSNDRTNLVLACETCNSQKSDRTLFEWIEYHFRINNLIYIPTFIIKGAIKWLKNLKA